MIVVVACERDIPAWLDLTVEVEPLFGPMIDDPGFHRALRRNVVRGTAFCARAFGGMPGAPLMGGLLFSPHPPQYTIGWLAVAREWRRYGVGRLLVEHALGLVSRPAEISVTTFGPGVEGGEGARAFYARLGFAPDEDVLLGSGPDGRLRQVYRLVLR
jgi:GNAT superfamily N-acetyltransferase